MDSVKSLFKWKKPYQLDKTNDLFVKAVRQNCLYHYNHNDEYKAILDKKNVKPDDIKKMNDIAKIPPIPTLYFKHHYLLSVKERKVIVKATSSGTSGKNMSKIGFDFYSLMRGWDMVKKLFRYHKMWRFTPQRFVVFGYEHKFKNSKAIAKTAWGFTFSAPARSKDYAIRYIKGKYEVDLDNIEQKLKKYAKGHFPVRTIGFPAYTFFLLKQMQEHNIHVKLPKGSLMTLGGGWKQFYAEKVSKEDFYALAYDVLGIEKENIIEFFGAVEHPIMWTQCQEHHFHTPIYARVIIRDPDTLKPLPNGQVGLINLITPMAKSVPLLSVMTDDLGILHDEPCKCGIHSPYLEIIGRVGIEDIKTCAAGAEDLLKEIKA